MLVKEKVQIPVQKCKNCLSFIQVEHKDLKWDDSFLKRRKDRWTCPLCRERDNYLNMRSDEYEQKERNRLH